MINQTILITGATGFLGSHMLYKLIELNFKVVVLKRSFSNTFRIDNYFDKIKLYDIDTTLMEKVFKENKIDIILHMATQYGRKEENILDLVESNLMLPLKLLTLAKLYNIKTFINTDTLLDKRINSYTLSKKQFKNWLEYFSKYMVCVNVSLEHFFGPNDDNTKFVTFIIKNLIEEVKELDLTLGEQERDFIYIDDVVDAFIIILNYLDKDNGFYEYEIGSGINVKIKDFILNTVEILNSKTKLNFGALPYRSNEVMKSNVNLTEISKLGWFPKIKFDDGLKKTIELEKGINI